jgi:small-conductance mechanosensitive channel
MTLEDLWSALTRFLRHELMHVGAFKLTLGGLLGASAVLVLVVWGSRLLSEVLSKILKARGTDAGVAYAIGRITRYALLAVGLVTTLQIAGLDLSALLLVGSALGIGVGLGLQSVTTNFVGGLLLLFERPIKVGDRIEVGGLEGNVVDISPRATTVLTNDNVAVIVPNSELVSKQVVNWSSPTRDVRFRVQVGVSYSANEDEVRDVLVQVGKSQPGVLEQPAPSVLLREFADSAMVFELRVWTREYTDRPGALKSELLFKIRKAFRERNIEIPFPQRDVHLKRASRHEP